LKVFSSDTLAAAGAAAEVHMAAVVEAHAPEIAFSLSSVYSYWKEFDLDGRRSKLDEVGW
jgi:hypothetical protein